MIEKLTDFFKDMKERLSSPFFSSFILTWLIFNWRIVIALLFYKNQELHLDGYNSYIDLITRNSNIVNFLWKPLTAALIYTFLFPFFRSIIIVFNAWIKSKTNLWSLNISKSGKISVAKYIELRDTYEKRTVILENVLEKESKYLGENEELKNKNLETMNVINNLNSELSKWKSYNNPSLLNGDWNYIIKSSNVDIDKVVRKIFIFNGSFRVRDADNNDEEFTINNLSGNPELNTISFLLTTTLSDSSKEKRYFILKIDTSFNRLVGVDNFGTNIIFERITNSAFIDAADMESTS